MTMMLTLSGCGQNTVKAEPFQSQSENGTQQKILIAYFTWADNTVVEDQEAALPDSATVMELLGVYRAEIMKAQPEVQSWLKGLGFL